MSQKIKNILLASLPFLSILLIWILSLKLNLAPKWMIPSPITVLKTFINLAVEGTIFRLVLISFTNSFPPFVIALVLSIVLGVLIGLNKTAEKIFMPFLSAIYPIPSLAWLPLIILLVGFNRWAIWLVIFISSFLRIIYNVVAGVRSIKPSWILAAKNYGLNKQQIIFKIILPGALPYILTGIRIGFGSSWRSLIGAEMLAVSIGGLGKFIWMSQWFFRFDKVLVGVAVIALIGFFIEVLIFKKLEKKICVKWGLIQDESKL